jgi:hypothetical protein
VLTERPEDWRVSLRPRGRSLATIASYLTVGESFAGYLVSCGLLATVAKHDAPTGHAERDLADMRDRSRRP